MRPVSIAVGSSAFVAVLCLLAIVATLVMNASSVVMAGDGGLLGTVWAPAQERFGILPMLYGTVIVAALALLFAVPLGIGSAVFTSEMLSGRWRIVAKSTLEVLAGIPSIVYGLIGVAFLSTWIENFFDLQAGRTILTAGILLGIMVLPTIITLCDDAFQNVPNRYREAAAGLGYYRFETVRSVLLPIAKADVVGAVLLALGRALGETMAVMLVIGSIDRIPDPWTNVLAPGQTITSKLGRETAEAAIGSMHFSALIFLALVLVLMTTTLAAIAQFLLRHEVRLND